MLASAALAVNTLTLGIPCVYYGSEQGFDGQGGNDRYIREAMFGGAFGPFRSRDRHRFDETNPVFTEAATLLAIRAEEITLRRGRQYLRQISGDGLGFGFPCSFNGLITSIVAWSRILATREIVCAVNTDRSSWQTAWVTIDAGLHAVGDRFMYRHRSDGAAGTITRSPRERPRHPGQRAAGGRSRARPDALTTPHSPRRCVAIVALNSQCQRSPASTSRPRPPSWARRSRPGETDQFRDDARLAPNPFGWFAFQEVARH